MAQTQNLMTAQEVAEYFHVDRVTIYRWVRLGKIPSYKIVRSRLFDRDELDQWTREHKANGHAE